MPAAKTYKCGYKHCRHPEDRIPEGDGVMIGCRHYHKNCADEANTIKRIRDFYCNNISETVVVSFLNKVINTVIYDKNVSADYLMFCLEYVVEHKMRINSPAGLHYIIDNKKIKDVYNDKTIIRQKKEMKAVCDDEFDFDVKTSVAQPPKRRSFTDILRGDIIE